MTEDEKTLRKWKVTQLSLLKRRRIDEYFEKMNDIERAVWTKIANAESPKDIAPNVWALGDTVLDNARRKVRR